jgi:biopolymer transport protein ExbD
MPVQTPGPRLLNSVPFRFLGGKKSGGRKTVNPPLNLIPFVDVFMMIVIFLLGTFSATGELLMQQRGVELPKALNDKELQRAPIVTITRDTVSFKGDSVADAQALMADQSAEWKIPELLDRLQLERFNFEKQDIPEDRKALMRGLLVLQADKGVDAKVLNRVMKTAYAAEYTEVMFAIAKAKK